MQESKHKSSMRRGPGLRTLGCGEAHPFWNAKQERLVSFQFHSPSTSICCVGCVGGGGGVFAHHHI